MQRLLISLMMLASTLTLTACDKAETPPAAAQSETAAPPAASGEVTFDQFEAAKGFTVGTGPSIMAQTNAYVLFDPQCPHCADLWNNSKPLQGQAKMKWIPVGFLNSKSKTQAAVLLEAENPAELMNKYEAEMAARGSSSVLDGSPSKEALEQVERNTEILRQSRAQSVPAIFYRNPKNAGNMAMVTGSAPTESIAGLLGVPYQAQ